MARTLQQSQCALVIGAVQKIVKLAVQFDRETAIVRPTFIKGMRRMFSLKVTTLLLKMKALEVWSVISAHLSR